MVGNLVVIGLVFTVCFRELSKFTEAGDTLYYPLRLANDKSLLSHYMALATGEKNMTFIGRLGTYRYLDMHVVIGESLDLAKTYLSKPIQEWPTLISPSLEPRRE